MNTELLNDLYTLIDNNEYNTPVAQYLFDKVSGGSQMYVILVKYSKSHKQAIQYLCDNTTVQLSPENISRLIMDDFNIKSEWIESLTNVYVDDCIKSVKYLLAGREFYKHNK